LDDVDVCDGAPHLAEAHIGVEGVGSGSVTIVGCD
jgi:hypothetical protein